MQPQTWVYVGFFHHHLYISTSMLKIISLKKAECNSKPDFKEFTNVIILCDNLSVHSGSKQFFSFFSQCLTYCIGFWFYYFKSCHKITHLRCSSNGICVSFVYIRMLTDLNINIRDTDSIGTILK